MIFNYDASDLVTSIGDVSSLTTTATDLAGAVNEVNGNIANAVLIPSERIAIPSAGSSVTKTLTGLTESHLLFQWRFSSSAENDPPVNLSWTTTADSFTISNTGGSTSETILPTFVLPTAAAIS